MINIPKKLFSFLFCFPLLLLSGWLQAQSVRTDSVAEPEGPPNRLNILKLTVTTLIGNEVRLSFEKELTYRSSLEFDAGYIFANPFWSDRFGKELIASGFGVGVSYRQYFDKKYYSIPPTMRSYLSPALVFRQTSYENEWFVLPHPNPDFSECQLESQTFTQVGFKALFGFQSRRGRVVFDIYSGLGIKYIKADYRLHAVNEGTEVCEIIPETIFYDESLTQNDLAVTLHAGAKIGFRFGKHKPFPQEIETDIPLFEGRKSTPKKQFSSF